MKLKISGSAALAMMMLLPFRVGPLGFPVGTCQEPAPKTYKVVSHETHERVMDIVFERDEARPDYDFVLRFEPSFSPESQIIIRKGIGKIEVVEYRSLSGNIYQKLNGVMARGGKEDPIEMAKSIQIERRVIAVPIGQIRQWRASLADSISASMKVWEQRSAEVEKGVGTITLDGSFYRLWYDQVGSHISIKVLDDEVSDREVTGELALVRWMNSVRLDTTKRRSPRISKR